MVMKLVVIALLQLSAGLQPARLPPVGVRDAVIRLESSHKPGV